MKYEFFKSQKKIDLSHEKYECIELAFFEVFKNMLMNDKSVADEFKLYCFQYHMSYNWLNFMEDSFLCVLLETGSRELQLSQIMNNSTSRLGYDYNDSFFFGRMIGDFLIRCKDISVLRCDKKELLTTFDDYGIQKLYKECNIDGSYKNLKIAPLKLQVVTKQFKKSNFVYVNEDYIYDPKDMCSYLGGYPTDLKAFKKTN